MRTFEEEPKPARVPAPVETVTARAPVGEASPILHLQRAIGNHAVGRMLQDRARGGIACAAVPAGTATAMEDQGKAGSEAFEGEPMKIPPEGPDQTPAPLNQDGLIDGEWSSEVAAHAFVNGGKAGTAIINWAGGAGGTTPGVGVVTTVAPVIETSAPPAAGGTAQAWVRDGTGTATVSRSYTGSLVGANGPNYWVTARAAARIDRHEENHIAHSRTHHNTFITPLEARVAQHA